MDIPSLKNSEPLLEQDSLSGRSQRLLKGQFYTPSPVCDFMLSLAGLSASHRMLEPGCGDGAFLLRAGDRIRHQKGFSGRADNLFGIELDPTAYEAAKQRLQAVSPILRHADFISPAADALGLFDVVVGNPPYVRQEHVKQSLQMDKKAAHAYLLAKYADALSEDPCQQVLFAQTADLYLWFFLQAASLLKPGGRLVFITSNSWLNASFGGAFQRFLTRHFHLRALVESACERWFADAAVNPLIVVLDKKDPAMQASEAALPVKILSFKVPLKEWMPQDIDEAIYWQALDEKLKALLQGDNDTASSANIVVKTIQSAQLISHPMDEVHVFLQNKSMVEVNLKTSMDEVKLKTDQDEPPALAVPSGAPSSSLASEQWAFIMRAPNVLMRLLEDKACWLRLDALGAVRYPLKTGINRFFYLNCDEARQWGIEAEFLFPVVKSLRKLQSYRIQPEACGTLLFSCPHPKADLERQGQTGALRYIQWGETQVAMPRQKRGHPVPWPQVPSVRHHRPWHFVRPLLPAHVLCSRFYDQRFFFPQCQGEILEDQTFYGLTLRDDLSPDLTAGLLNTTLSMALLEFIARNSLGEGVLQFARCDMASFPIINPALYTAAEQQEIAACFGQMAQRPVQMVRDEVLNFDRAALDAAVLLPLFKRTFPGERFETLRDQLVESLLAKMDERKRMARSR